jgi:hypothetical protein
MKLIAHRGNLRGPNSEKENHPDYCRDALKAGFDLEVDVWYVDKKLYTGHDKPTYGPVKYDFFLNKKIWIHAKNGDAFDLFRIDYEANVFWHTTEDWVFTSCGFVWTYPNKTLYRGSVCVLPEMGWLGEIYDCHAVCTDYVYDFREHFELK